MLADPEGKVRLHSRIAFEVTCSKEDANFQNLLWAIQIMRHHRLERVVFACEDVALAGAVNKPMRWHAYKFQGSLVRKGLEGFKEWDLEVERGEASRGVILIVQSVPRDDRS
ncbi:unnamed protein product [Arabis nemorensis]|uniref:RNase H type-1 domain-containing protein n=1 Tax=Arabis nemorensis TaxID=586526 RepID=A0A565B974_9BRAS|nr:unnamed protein product [Arabis nemorensis]